MSHRKIMFEPGFGTGGGEPGPKGDTGDRGPQGEQGIQGVPGESGSVVATRIRRSTNQGIPSGTAWTDLVWDTAAYQQGGTFWTSGATVTIPEDGFYQLFAEGTLNGTGILTNVSAELRITANGAVVAADEKIVPPGAPDSLFCMAQRFWAAGTELKVQARHSMGTTVDMLSQGDHAPDLIIAKLGGAKGDPGGDSWTWLKLPSNSTVSTTAFANVTGLSFIAEANTTYLVEVFGAYQTAATTTGIGLALDVPAGSTVIGMNIVSTSATAIGGTEQIADATTTGATTGVRAANTNTPISGRWVVAIGGTGGTVQLMQRSEIAGSNTVLQTGITIMGRRAI